jgi:hypothetical protein
MNEDTRLKIRAAIVIAMDAMLVTVLLLLSYVDRLVHGTLYNYGLVFSVEWAEPYWIMMRASMALIAIVFSILTILDLPHPSLKKKS